MSNPPMGERTALYRLFNADDELLYVGITWQPLSARMGEHAAEQPWWREIDHATAIWYPTRQEADQAETKAIQAEHPKYNVKKKNRIKVTPAQARAQRARFHCDLSDEAVQKLVERDRMTDIYEMELATGGVVYKGDQVIIKRGSFRELMGFPPPHPHLPEGTHPIEKAWAS